MTIILAQQLKDRLDKNLADFKAMLPSLEKETIIAMARKINAMEYAHRQLTTEYEYVTGDIEFLMLYDNPLEAVAEEWASRLDDMYIHFDMAMSEFLLHDIDDDDIDDDDNDDCDDCGDCDDYGDEDDCSSASESEEISNVWKNPELLSEILTEIVEIGKKLFG